MTRTQYTAPDPATQTTRADRHRPGPAVVLSLASDLRQAVASANLDRADKIRRSLSRLGQPDPTNELVGGRT